MKTTNTFSSELMKRWIRGFWLCIIIIIPFYVISKPQVLTVYIGQSEIVDFSAPVKRIAIANPNVADATVTSPNQLILNGKEEGTTSLIVWYENEAYTKFKLKTLKEAASYQIMLQVRFIEINKTALKELGSDFLIKQIKVWDERIDIGSYGGKISAPSDPLILGNTVDFFLTVPTKNFSTIFKALHENNLVSILAAPNLSSISGKEASFLAGGEFPVPLVSGAAGMQTVTIQFREYGIKLKFVPTVLDSNLINLQVAAEVSNLDFENGIQLSGFQIPSLSTRKAETTVELKEEQYLIMGGLLSEETAKTISRIPALGHIPILGALFSSTKYQIKETELLITLTPKIIYALTKEQIPELKLNQKNKE